MSVRLQQKSGADLRKLQLVDIASELICREGVDSLGYSALAQLAGCTRALVYRYFPKKSDLYVAIAETFYDELDQLMSVEEQQQTVGTGFRGSADSRRFFSLLFEVLERRGVAALVLTNALTVNKDLKEYNSTIKKGFEQRWLDAFKRRNITGFQARLLMENCNSIIINYFTWYSDGKITRDAALDQIERTVYALVDIIRDA